MAIEQPRKYKLPTITLEICVLALIIAGLPVIGLMWFGFKAAFTILILTLIGLGLIKLRFS